MSALSRAKKYPQWYVAQMLNECFDQDLTLMHRDCELTLDQLERYRVGQILCEKAPLCASYRVSGVAAPHRIALVSVLDGARVEEISHLQRDPLLRAQGRCVFAPSSRFKVIDIYRRQGKTQILLLHLPSDERWRLFEGPRKAFERQMVSFARQSFHKALEQAPLAELLDHSWQELCAKPVGFDGTGEPYALDGAISERLRALGEMDFRDVVGSLLYVAPTDEACHEEGLATFGYVDPTCGLCLEVLGGARLSEQGLFYERCRAPRAPLILATTELTQKAAQVVDESLTFFGPEIAALKKRVGEAALTLQGARHATYLDRFRDRWHPDIVEALLFKEDGLITEAVRLKTQNSSDAMIFAELLDEPQGSFGSHKGDELALAHGMLAGEPQCFALPAFGPLHERCALEHGSSPVEHAKPQVVSTGRGALVLPTVYLPLDEAERGAKRGKVFEFTSDLAHIEVEAFELPQLGAFPHELTNSLIQGVRQRLSRGQGLIEVDVGTTLGARAYYYAIDKTLLESASQPFLAYHLIFCLDGGTEAITLEGYFFDLSLGGLRQSVAFEDLVKELGSQKAAQAAWAHDPYDPSITQGALKDHGDYRSYDKDFPAHALTEARRLVKFMSDYDALAVAKYPFQHPWSLRHLRKSA